MPAALSGLAERHVAQLRIQATTDESARHASTLIEDALNIASLPAADRGQLLLIRRLPLGRISNRLSSASLALHIERAVAEASLQAVRYDPLIARNASAIVFADRAEALLQLANLQARGASTDAWFWPSVVNGWDTTLSPDRRWRLLLDNVHTLQDEGITAAAVIEMAFGSGAAEALLESLPSGIGAQWLRLSGWTDLVPSSSEASLQMELPEVICRMQRRWSPADDRLVWFCTLLAIAQQPRLRHDKLLPVRVAAALSQVGRLSAASEARRNTSLHRPPQTTLKERGNNAPSVESPHTAEAASAFHTSRPADQHANTGTESTASTRDAASLSENSFVPRGQSSLEEMLQTARSSKPTEDEAHGAFPRELAFSEDVLPARVTLEGELSAGAGVFLLIRVLDQLGFRGYVKENPELAEAGFPEKLLWFIAERVGISDRDPLTEFLLPEDPLAASISFPAALPLAVQEILGTRKETDRTSHFEIWLTAVRRWCRRNPRMGLANVVRRPGRLFVSRTHLDVCFDLRQVDIRIRRHGLDINPGWVPWLGRVVQFHYEETVGLR